MGSGSAHIKDAGISLAKDLPGLIHHQHTQSNDFWIGAATRTNFLTLRGQEFLLAERHGIGSNLAEIKAK
jgi:hypothetical protein